MELMNIEEVASFFKVNKNVIRVWLCNKTLPENITVKVGRRRFFIKHKLEEFLDNKSTENIK